MGVDGADGAPEEIARSRLDLDKDDLTSPFDDQIELATGAAPVAVPRAVALEQEEQQARPTRLDARIFDDPWVLVPIVP